MRYYPPNPFRWVWARCIQMLRAEYGANQAAGVRTVKWDTVRQARDILAAEEGTYIKDWGGKLPVALIYPNSYYVGMSSLGLHTLYWLLNRRPDVAAERVFWADQQIPYSLETQQGLQDFSVLGVSLSFELDLLHLVEMLRRAAPCAADAGVMLGLENSLSPADNRKLVDQVDHPSVKVYYDPHNMARFGHAAEAVPGIKLLGRDRICQVHVKNGERLIEEPGLVDWRTALQALNEIGYGGWYVFESDHTDHAQVVEATAKNIAFLRRNCEMPFE